LTAAPAHHRGNVTKAWQCDACGIRGVVDVVDASDDARSAATLEHARRSPNCEGLLRLERPFLSQAILSFNSQRRGLWLHNLLALLGLRRRAL
jgi:hypothetical protein